MADATSSKSLPFTRLGGYEVVAPLSEGGMAIVYLGRSLDRERRAVALKVIRPELCRDKEFVAMFLDEAKIASRLSHPNIVAIHELGKEGKRLFLAMELLLGHTLLEVWDACRSRRMRLPLEVVAWIGARVADALQYAHELTDEQGAHQHVVHRDINPGNLFITQEGVPKIIDFGLAKSVNRLARTAKGVVKGKLAYLSPEQTRGHSADSRTDIFALGVTLWELTVDQRLFRVENDVETVRRVQATVVPDPTKLVPGYPTKLATAVLRALAREPAARYPRGGDLARDLDEVAGGSQQEALAKLMLELFPEDEAPLTPERLEAWDEAAQRLTTLQAVIVPSSADATQRTSALAVKESSVRSSVASLAWGHEVAAEINARVRALGDAGTKDALAVARAKLELAILDETLGDGTRASAHAAAALAASAELPAAHMLLRRYGHARGAAGALLVHLDAEIAACGSEPARADLLAERARVIEGTGVRGAARVEAWERALAVDPRNPAALRGAEAAHRAEASAVGAPAAAFERLAAHLGKMADAYAAEPRLAAWIRVERARVLDRHLGKPDHAWGELQRALELEPGLGPVRSACARHAAAHRDAASQVALLADEAMLVAGAGGASAHVHAARLELDAACIADAVLADSERAVALLARAAARAPTTPRIDRRVLDDLVRHHEARGRWLDALVARRARLPLIEGARALAHEHATLAAIAARIGDEDTALAELREARALAPDEPLLFDTHDRLLASPRHREARLQLWVLEAARRPSEGARARALVRAARIAEDLGQRDEAVAHLRAALVAAPGDSGALDALSRLLTSAPTEAAAAELHARIAMYEHAAAHAADSERRIAYLEKIAILWEELGADPVLAKKTYEAILTVDPDRRSALVGLARTAARSGDAQGLARALLEEARRSTSDAAKAELRVRAASALVTVEPERALAIAREVLVAFPANDDAQAIELRVHEDAGRWEMVDRALATRIASTPKAGAAAAWLARAELQRTRLHAPAEALKSLEAARAIDPSDPVVAEAIASLVLTVGGPRALPAAFEALAGGAATGEERARHRLRAGEVLELMLDDDERAAALYARELAEDPSSELVVGRLLRVLGRRAGSAPRAALEDAVEAILASGVPGAPDSVARTFDVALLLLDAAPDSARATALLESVLAFDPSHVPALRTLEVIARASGAIPLLANVLSQQADAFASDAAKLGALWAEASLVEWHLPESTQYDLYEAILERAPGDRAALDAIIRRTLPRARRGEPAARAIAAKALAALSALASDDTSRLVVHLEIALLLEADEAAARRSLDEFRAALRVDRASVTAAAGTARLAAELADDAAATEAAIARAEIAPDPTSRAAFLVQAAELSLVAGARPRAAELLERALEANPNGASTAQMLAKLRGEDGQRDRLIQSLRAALKAATTTEAILVVGSELARAARTRPEDLSVAVDAMQRVRAAAPAHAPSLMTLAELLVLSRAWVEAAATLEAAAACAESLAEKLVALFELVRLLEGPLSRSEEAVPVLRQILEADPTNAGALHALSVRLRSSESARGELATVLERLAGVEPSPERKAAISLDLASLRAALGDREGVDRALVFAASEAPSAAVLHALASFHAGDDAGHVRALAAAAARALELGRADASVLAALGQLEVETGRFDDGVAHARAALAMSPGLHETRVALAAGLTRLAATDEASKALLPLLLPDPAPLLSLRDPAGALALLEKTLAKQESIVVRELRALAGAVDDGGLVELRARRLPLRDPAATLDRGALMTGVVPIEGRHVLVDVAAAVAGIEQKVFGGGIAELGISARDRLPPRADHPLRAAFDRLMRLLALPAAELVVTDQVTYTRIFMQDVPWIVAPAALALQPEPVQVASLACVLVRASLGVPWIEDVPPAHAHAFLVAAARQAAPHYAPDLQDAVSRDYERRVARAIGRRQKKQLTELAQHLEGPRGVTLPEIEALVLAVARAELRVAFLVTGDLLATLDDLRALDAPFARDTSALGPRALAAVLAHPLAGDTVRYALSPDATALRRRIGTTW